MTPTSGDSPWLNICLWREMTERNFKQELVHSCYYDMENGYDSETIDYDCLIAIITELCDRIEKLEVAANG